MNQICVTFARCDSTFRVVLVDSGMGAIIFGRDMLDKLKESIIDLDIELIHICDDKNVPYGNKTESEISALAEASLEAALKLEPDLVLVACNTSSACMDHINVPEGIAKKTHFLIEKSTSTLYSTALEKEKSQKNISIGVFATRATIACKVYQNTLQSLHTLHQLNSNDKRSLNIFTYTPDKWVTYVENMKPADAINAIVDEFKMIWTDEETKMKNCSAIGMFCTHYPVATKKLREFIEKEGSNTILVTQGDIFATTVLEYIKKFTNQRLGKGSSNTKIKSIVIATGNNNDKFLNALEEFYIDKDIKKEVLFCT